VRADGSRVVWYDCLYLHFYAILQVLLKCIGENLPELTDYLSCVGCIAWIVCFVFGIENYFQTSHNDGAAGGH